MDYLLKRVSYLQGLADGFEIDENSKEGKLLLEIIDVLSDIVDEVKDSNKDLENYVDMVEEDLSELEDYVYDNDEYEFDDDYEDYDDFDDFDDEEDLPSADETSND
ncbi:hypothetical protein J2S72_000179 [Peptoniphilus koenoeneniae]|jgi:hypothetical protein|uniref:Uncharacterized protein n=1 Tax=Peptoniphilus koenoeneniae TaxID=507751 RepID=A0ABU0ASD5_9FIRM|nr:MULTISPECIES: CD1247 N-terminal domain-containing protein [Peptoniphilus]ERT56827.1 hypothetical protein HMPREF1253_1022 [Peptoniphilus sp. BV3C26]MDQ0274183.1 hypothetical protein [Peptoniphilus koenoeneniae]